VAELSWHFFGTPHVRIGGKFGLSVRDREIKCQSMELAKELSQKIQEALLLSGG
jgi:hypothetical protein